MVGYKSELRKIMMAKRNELLVDKKEKLDRNIFQKLISNPMYLNAKVIFIYVSYENEVNTHEVIKHALQSGKIVCIPKVISKDIGMVAMEINSFDELTPGAYGILEPSSRNGVVIDPKEIDMIILPGLAFDKFGGRLGYGGGFYDRYLLAVKKDTPKIALGYSFQLVEKVPTEELDVPIDDVITD